MPHHPVQTDVVPTPTLFECGLCPEPSRFTQKQVLRRHIREKHQPRFECSHPGCDYKWTQSRTSEYRKHLKSKHGLEDDEIGKLLAQPPLIECGGGPPHFSRSPIGVDYPSPPLIPCDLYDPWLGDGEPESTTTEDGDRGLEQLAATHAPRILSEEEFAMLSRHYGIHGGFRFPSHPGTTDISPSPGVNVPALPAHQPGMQEPCFSSGISAPQAPHLALPPPTQEGPLTPSEGVWGDSHLCSSLHGTQQYDEAAFLYSWSVLGDGNGQEGDF